jgi:putative ABC transport system substrate-binding protein
MRRREFIAGLGSAAAWPVVARGQQGDRMRRIGVLMNLAADDPETLRRMAAFVQGLKELGWAEGRNVQIDLRSGLADADRYRRYAAELLALAPDVLLANGAVPLGVLQQITRTLPIVFVNTTDPVGGGFVESLARPGGNATGFMSFEYSMSGKWLQLLKQVAPSVTRVAVLRDPVPGSGTTQFGVIQAMAQLLRVEVNPVNMRDAGEMERAVAAFARTPNGGARHAPQRLRHLQPTQQRDSR